MNKKKLKKTKFSQVKAIFFDFGNVIMDIDISLSINKFKQLGLTGFSEKDIHPDNSGIFLDLEIGAIAESEFLEKLRGNANVSNEQIIEAWNILLLGYDFKRFELINQLRQNYSLYILSNTNKIHHDYFEKLFNQQNPFHKNFKEFFNHIYYSDELNCRKPNPEIYQKVMSETGFKPEQILFIDDNQPNLVEPAKMGWNTYLLKKPETILDLFD